MSLLHFFPLKDLEVVAAKNAILRLADGRELVDVGGASHGAAIVGHCHPRVVEAVTQQAAKVMHVAHLYPNPARTAFLEQLHALLPPDLDKTFLGNSGTEAVEAILKFAGGATGRSHFVAAENGFHGRTLGALSVTHKPSYREPIAGMTMDVDFVPFNDVEALKAAVTADTAGLILEPVQGEGGVVPGSRDYLRAARDVCDDRGALLLFDEVQTGMGRTGPFLAASHSGVLPDALSMGKGLAGGVPIGCAITRTDIAERLPAGFHGSTYGAAPIACAAGAAALAVWSDEKLADRSASEGRRFLAALGDLDHPAIAEVRGLGLMATVDVKIQPGPILKAMEQTGFVALAGGKRGIRFLPPLTIERQHLDGAVAALGAALG